jgi:hypothetical protein
MCRALTVLCVAPGPIALAELKRAAVSAEWELTPGAADADEALVQLERERPHVVVAIGEFGDVVAAARERFPAIRIITDRDLPGANAIVGSLAEVREAVKGLPRPGGPVRSAGS